MSQTLETDYSVATVAQLSAAIQAIDDAAASGQATPISSIILTADIGTSSDPLTGLPVIDLHGGTRLTIDGGGHTLDGGAGTIQGVDLGNGQAISTGSSAPGFTIASGTASILGLTFSNLSAYGANATLRGTGGGAGLGGALFVGANAIVSLSNDTFVNDSAQGGSGASVDYVGDVSADPGQPSTAAAGFGAGGSGAAEEITTGGPTTSTHVGAGGAAGFGGGGGAGIPAGAAGFGGGAGDAGTNGAGSGGGGLGAGGDIFVQQGGQLNISGGTFGAGQVVAGSSANSAGAGASALGATIFAQDGTVHLTPGYGQTVTLAGGFADILGSSVTGTDTGSASLQVYGVGTVMLGGDDTYSGGTTLAEGTLILGSSGAAGSGAITFASTGRSAANLLFSHANGFSNTIDGFGAGDSLVVTDESIASISYASGALHILYDRGSQDVIAIGGEHAASDFAVIDSRTIGSSATHIVQPTVSAIAASAAGPIVGAGGTVQFVLTVSVPNLLVSLSGGGPVLRLSEGLQAIFGGSSGSTLTFTYTAAAGDRSADLKVVGLDLGGSLVSDPDGVSLSTAGLSALPGADSGTAVRAAGPAVTRVDAVADAAGPLKAGHVVRFSLETSVPVAIDTSGGIPALSLGNGASANYDAASGQFTYVIQSGDDTGDLTVTALVPNGATLADSLGNGLDVVSFDAGGTPGAVTGLVIDTVAPSMPVLASLDAGAAGSPRTILHLSDVGAGAGARIVVSDGEDGFIVASGALGAPDASGHYSIGLKAPLGVGMHSLVATVIDAAGNRSDVSTALAVTIAAPSAPPPAVAIDGPEVSAVAMPAVTGTATAGASVTVTLDGTVLAPVIAGGDGTWRVLLASTPAAGLHDLTAQATDGGGTSTIVSTTLTQQAPPARADQAYAPITTAALVSGHGTVQFDPGTKQVTLADGVYNVSPDTDAAYAARLYFGALGRTPDAAGLSHWTGALTTGASPVAIAQAFLSSTEGTATLGSADNGTFVTDLYQTLLGRAPDPTAVAWVHSLDDGTSRASILASIAASDEAKGALAAKTTGLVVQDSNVAAITQAYQTAFGRVPDAAGGASWLASLRSGLSTTAMVRDFAASAEFASAHASQDNGGLVASLWQLGLGRAPSGGELTYETNALASGSVSRSDLLVQVATSTEGKGHLFGN